MSSLSMMESFFTHDLSSSSFLDTSTLFDEIVGARPCFPPVEAVASDPQAHIAPACAPVPHNFSSSPHATDNVFTQSNIMTMMDPLLLDNRSFAAAATAAATAIPPAASAPATTAPSTSVPPFTNINNNSNNIAAAAAFIAAAAAAAAAAATQQQQQQHSSVEPANILNAINFAANQFAQQQQHPQQQVQPPQLTSSSTASVPGPAANLATLAPFNLPPTKLMKKQKTAAVSVKTTTSTRPKKHQPALLPFPPQPQQQQQSQPQPHFVLDMLKREQPLPLPARSVSGTSQRLSVSSTDDGFHSESSSPCSPSAHYISDASVTSVDDSLPFASSSSSSSSSVPSSSSSSPSFQASSCLSLPMSSSSSSASSSSCSDDVDPTKAKRLARKAELARMSRKRKATRMGDLEAEVERLQKEIAVLKKAKQDRDFVEASNNAAAVAAAAAASLHVVDEDNGNETQAVNAALNHIVTAFHASQADADKSSSSSSSSSSSVDRSIESFVAAHTFASNSALKHLSNLQHHAHAILPLQFFQWLCSQPDSFYDVNASSSSSSASPSSSSLWMSLFVKELGLNEQQMKDLNALKTTVRKQTKICNDIEKAYKKLNIALKKQVSQRVENLEKIRSILSSGQLARFIDWTNKYAQVCLKIHLQEPANSNTMTAE